LSSLKCVEGHFGDAFVRVENGILVARRAVLVPNVIERSRAFASASTTAVAR
jgi:hypothetical protein